MASVAEIGQMEAGSGSVSGEAQKPPLGSCGRSGE